MGIWGGFFVVWEFKVFNLALNLVLDLALHSFLDCARVCIVCREAAFSATQRVHPLQ